jgi:N-acetylglutamate synthase-like GNAT family acetyltransferase
MKVKSKVIVARARLVGRLSRSVQSTLETVMNEISSQGMQIRRARQHDAAAVRELTRSAYAKWVPLIGREPTPMTADYDRAVREHMIDLLFVDAELTALIETASKPDHLLIENVAVLPACQGRGYGGFLLDHAEHLAASLGLPEIRLWTNKLFAANIAIYRRRGYTIYHEEPFRGGFVVHMSKRLATRDRTPASAPERHDRRRDGAGLHGHTTATPAGSASGGNRSG